MSESDRSPAPAPYPRGHWQQLGYHGLSLYVGRWPWGDLPGSDRGGLAHGPSAPGQVRGPPATTCPSATGAGWVRPNPARASCDMRGLRCPPAYEGGSFWKGGWAGQAGWAFIKDRAAPHCFVALMYVSAWPGPPGQPARGQGCRQPGRGTWPSLPGPWTPGAPPRPVQRAVGHYLIQVIVGGARGLVRPVRLVRDRGAIRFQGSLFVVSKERLHHNRLLTKRDRVNPPDPCALPTPCPLYPSASCQCPRRSPRYRPRRSQELPAASFC